MTLFGTAFRMGVEPFFFSHANKENPQKTYAQITNYFIILGSVILLGVVVFIDVLAKLLIRNSVYWEALEVVPIILLGSLCLGIYHNLSVWYKITDKTKIWGLYFMYWSNGHFGYQFCFHSQNRLYGFCSGHFSGLCQYDDSFIYLWKETLSYSI